MLIWRKKLNNQPEQEENQRLKAAKKDLLIKGGVVLFVIVVTLVLVFAMTAAWFTNVVSTGGLIFQVESWGFEGGVVVNQNVIQAAPGDDGILSMQITNTGAKNSQISVGVSKEFLHHEELKKRIFFYADTPSVVNEEQVEKVYLNNTNAYTYYLPAMNELILSEQVYTDVRLKWEWVYDVVGYYFRGTYDGNAFAVEEYLQPAQYNYDNAQYNVDGQLTRVDANTDVLQYVQKLTVGDGYPGSYTVGTHPNTGKKCLMQDGQPVETTQGCYPIDPDNNIWLYLCTRQEIQRNTAWDTQYGMSALEAQELFQVRITVIGQQYEPEIVEIADQNSLKQALTGNDGHVVTLQQDITLTETLALSAGSNTVLDLNGHTITSGQDTVFSVARDAKLTMLNGTISGDSAKTTAIQSVGGQITFSKTKIENVKYAVSVEDYKTNNANGDNSFVRILDSDISAENVAIKLYGDGTASAEKTVLIIQNSKVHSNYFAISGNGTATNPGRFGTDTQIVNSEIYGYYAGVYQPQKQSATTISNSTVSGMTGLAIKGGDLTVLDSIIKGLGTDAEVTIPTESNLTGSGFVDTGDGIYVETNYDYPVSITISGNSNISCIATNAQAIRVFPASQLVRVSVSSGVFTTDVSAFLMPGYVCTQTDGQFTVTPQ